MRYFALASDYDGTLAEKGAIHPDTLRMLELLRNTGRQLLLVTGRLLPDLKSVFPEYEVFGQIVAENGAVLYNTGTKAETVLCEAPPAEFATALARKGVTPLEVGRVIVATLDIHKQTVLQTIEELGLELQIIFNKGSAMVLPSGVNKATGLHAALRRLGLSAHNTVGVGDAENDHAFLQVCERSVAVANALPSLKAKADLITIGERGKGVSELIARLLQDDLASVPARDERDSLVLGKVGVLVRRTPVYGTSLLVSRTSKGEPTTVIADLMGQLVEAGYQFLAFDPRSEYQAFDGAVVLGDPKRAPTTDEVLKTLASTSQNLIVNLLGMPPQKRPVFFEGLVPRLREMRVRTGRPHWVILDEGHHLMPVMQRAIEDGPVRGLTGAILIAMQPDELPPSVLCSLDTIIATGDKQKEAVRKFSAACNQPCPPFPESTAEQGEALLWSRKEGGSPMFFRLRPAGSDAVIRMASAMHDRTV
jgi:hypothetical protein